MLLVALLQFCLQALCARPFLLCVLAFRASLGYRILFATHLAACVNTTWAFPGSQLVGIAWQLYSAWEDFCTVLGFALCVEARFTSLAFGIGACRVKATMAGSVAFEAILPLWPIIGFTRKCFLAYHPSKCLKGCFLFSFITLNAASFSF